MFHIKQNFQCSEKLEEEPAQGLEQYFISSKTFSAWKTNIDYEDNVGKIIYYFFYII